MSTTVESPLALDCYHRLTQAIAPTLVKFSEIYNENIFFIKINIENFKDLSKLYDIKKLPTFMTFDVGSDNGSKESTHSQFCGANIQKIENKLKLLHGGIKKSTVF